VRDLSLLFVQGSEVDLDRLDHIQSSLDPCGHFFGDVYRKAVGIIEAERMDVVLGRGPHEDIHVSSQCVNHCGRSKQ
jgi:hypothetical protein